MSKSKSILREISKAEDFYRTAHIRALQAVKDGEMSEKLYNEMFPKISDDARFDREFMEAHIEYWKYKRPTLVLHGQDKAKFEYEWNTVKQVSGIHNVIQKWLAKEFALLWASWGAQNLSHITKTENDEKTESKENRK